MAGQPGSETLAERAAEYARVFGATAVTVLSEGGEVAVTAGPAGVLLGIQVNSAGLSAAALSTLISDALRAAQAVVGERAALPGAGPGQLEPPDTDIPEVAELLGHAERHRQQAAQLGGQVTVVEHGGITVHVRGVTLERVVLAEAALGPGLPERIMAAARLATKHAAERLMAGTRW
ncbi:hypothetical protein [Longispora albida]|uniref:hypothetical protein n=1 Tax=Longispora albida TaxID=203523 RepID=UPI00038139CB|nr:hypothetical protein [Longispora albida]